MMIGKINVINVNKEDIWEKIALNYLNQDLVLLQVPLALQALPHLLHLLNQALEVEVALIAKIRRKKIEKNLKGNLD